MSAPDDLPLPLPSERRRGLITAVIGMCLCARGNGADDTSLKLALLNLRSGPVGILRDDEAATLISDLGIGSA
ncbi:MAG: hypothetical protein AB7F22_10500 [Reyranella sp.]|uniref:hypothetical protein n=1 Tax=Reyranella sp. TaxID=1929291 RepID=UPI003D0A44F8